MTTSPDEPTNEVLRDVWDGGDVASMDADCSPTKVCRNARDFTFDGIAEDGDDLATSWRNLLEREGKLATEPAPSIRELLLDASND